MKDLISKKTVLDVAKTSIIEQGEAIKKVANLLDKSFAEAVEMIYKCKGRVVIAGVGKSAIIANKIVATLNSTGTPSIFMHAGDAIHGDLGLIKHNDIVLLISKSGNTPEIKVLLPLIKRSKNRIIAITGDKSSFLAKKSDYVFNSYVEKEVCPNNLAPTTSTSTQLVIGDALAVSLITMRKFTKDDFAKFHPGGNIGKNLFLTVEDFLYKTEHPNVNSSCPIKDVIVEISEKRMGITAVVKNGNVIGVITDGDLRRMLSRTDNIANLYASDVMSKKPKTININELATKAMILMKSNKISQLIVLNNKKQYKGVIHIHDLIKEGII